MLKMFTYLKSFLTGEAEGCIKGLAATDANYREALEIMDQRYGNMQVIVKSHGRADKIASSHRCQQYKKYSQVIG